MPITNNLYEEILSTLKHNNQSPLSMSFVTMENENGNLRRFDTHEFLELAKEIYYRKEDAETAINPTLRIYGLNWVMWRSNGRFEFVRIPTDEEFFRIKEIGVKGKKAIVKY